MTLAAAATPTSTDLLLDAADVSKRYGAVVALSRASLAVRPGEIHALMGANGAGKSTLVKILTGAVVPDSGRITIRGQERISRSPAEARRNGLISVYQEPAVIPDLDIRANLRLTDTPVDAFRHWLNELGLEKLNLSSIARRLPLATLRIVDLARALAIEPDILLLDEMTAALPANLSERVLQVVQELRGDRSVIFISHRMIEIAAICDRATVLRNGETVGVVDVAAGSEEKIVELMLGEGVRALAERDDAAANVDRTGQTPRVGLRNLSAAGRLKDASFDLYAGEVLGVVALEGQGQDELFDVLSGSARPSGGTFTVDGKNVSFRHPADAIRLGMVYIAADRAEALLMQRSVRENISLPSSASIRHWGWINLGKEKKKVDKGVSTLQIDARAGAEVRRLSGGNQQKVTIARWVADGVKTMLCFDPTRGIDIRTKGQIYVLLRDLAAAGAAILLYTSELKEIQLACDRVVVISGGIDLSISSQMALTSCIAATLMKNNPGDAISVGVVVVVLLLGLLLGAINGGLIVATRVPDIIVTLATFFVWAGFALLVSPGPGGSSAQWLKDLVVGQLGVDFIPKAAVLLLVLVVIVWIPVRRSRSGLSMYAIGSNRLAAFRSGVPVNRTKILSYMFAGLFAGLGGLSLTAITGIGSPVPDSTYVLISIAAVVLGGVSLAGGVGGVIGPILAVVALQLIRDAMTYMKIDSNYGLVAQGFILIGVLMVGSFVQMRRNRA